MLARRLSLCGALLFCVSNAASAQSCEIDVQLFAVVVKDLADSVRGAIEINPLARELSAFSRTPDGEICTDSLAPLTTARKAVLKQLGLTVTTDAGIRGCPGTTTTFENEYIRKHCPDRTIHLGTFGFARPFVPLDSKGGTRYIFRFARVTLTSAGSITQIVEFQLQGLRGSWTIVQRAVVEAA